MGSTSYITNADGEVCQHVEYIPFGKTLFEEHLNSEVSPYLFNGKERDSQTGLYYYGARYYDPKISLWLSVDPLAEKYLNISPYIYCANNPIKYIDPDGNDFIATISQDENGNWQMVLTTTVYVNKAGGADTSNEANAYQEYFDNIKNNFQGNYKSSDGREFQVSFNITYKNDDGTEKNKFKNPNNKLAPGYLKNNPQKLVRNNGNNYIELENSFGRSTAHRKYPNIGFSATIFSNHNDLRTVLHEVFHLFGFGDRYDDGLNSAGEVEGSITHKGYLNNIFGAGAGLEMNQTQIDFIGANVLSNSNGESGEYIIDTGIETTGKLEVTPEQYEIYKKEGRYE